jgi:LysR family transcriptional regulator, glycine cleavage system transcriptional activator
MHNGHAEAPRLYWLNTLVAFEAAARLGSLTLAAGELYLTPGAVSRQVKLLEQALNVTLFVRSHNAIELTEAGRTFLPRVNEALAVLRRGVREVSGSGLSLTIRAPLTLTQRWLIPRIDSFRKDTPGIDLRFQTIRAATSDRIDVEVKYVRGALPPAEPNGEVFLLDRTAPICQTKLIAGRERPMEPQDVLSLPVLQDTADGWSWRQWCKVAGIPFQPRDKPIIFDTDEAAIDACQSGLGVAQANLAFLGASLASGNLERLCPTVETTLGAYYAVVQAPGKVADAFVAWLKDQGEATR